MAKQPAVKDDRMYRVTLTKSIKVGRLVVNPGPNTRLRGDALRKLLQEDETAVDGYLVVPEEA